LIATAFGSHDRAQRLQQYTYDPSGNPTASGTANDWPFQYQGMEKEFTDPAPYYYTGGGQFYSPQLVLFCASALIVLDNEKRPRI
jgi:hypothetical protein